MDRSLAHPEALCQLLDLHPRFVEAHHLSISQLLAGLPPRVIVATLGQGTAQAGGEQVAALVPVPIITMLRPNRSIGLSDIRSPTLCSDRYFSAKARVPRLGGMLGPILRSDRGARGKATPLISE